MSKLVYLKDVVTLGLDPNVCTGCGMCTIVCPRGVFVLHDRKAAIAQRDSCMECGACARNCPSEAISVSKGVGCASAVINNMLGRRSSSCCCSLDQYEQEKPVSNPVKSGCC